MRLTKTLLFVVVVLAGSIGLQAQDLHNSLFYMNPLHLNPAFTGAFEGTFRIGGIYRDQARVAIGSAAYSSPTIFVDVPIIMLGKRNWLGGGAKLFRDQAGDGDLTMSGLQLSAAFHYAMDKRSNNVLSIGAQYARVTRSVDNTFMYGDQLRLIQEGNPTALTQDNIGSEGADISDASFTDISAGLKFRSIVNKKTNYNLGFSIRHITSPDRDFNFGSSTIGLPIRVIGHGQLNTQLNEKWSFTPELYFTSISPASQFQIHAWAGYMLKPEKNIKINFGLGYRGNDAGQALFGLDYGDLKAQFAYDITLSELNEVNDYQGGFEIAVYYIAKIYKKPDVKPAILCPHL